MKKEVTLKDIAKELNVSVSTVSKALKNSKEIGEETIKKVKALADHYNYKTSKPEINLTDRNTRNIALIIPEIVHNFFSKIIRGVEQEANKNGYNVIVCLSNESFEKEVLNIETLANGGTVDGFIISLSKETQQKQDFKHLIEAEDQGMPLVMVDRITDSVACDKVIIDDERGAYNAVAHLIAGGRRKIALITTEDYISVGNLRTQGYLKALEEYSVQFDERLVLHIDENADFEVEIDSFFNEHNVDAIFTVNEIFAILAMKNLQGRGLHIPKDVAIVGFSDGKLLQYASPSITTVSQHGDEMGRTAAQMLIKRLRSVNEQESFTTRVITTTLIERESSR